MPAGSTRTAPPRSPGARSPKCPSRTEPASAGPPRCPSSSATRLYPGLDARRQPLHRRPAAAADAEPEAQADHQGPEPCPQQQRRASARLATAVSPSMVRSAFLATRLEFAPSRSSSSAVQFLDLPAFPLQPLPQPPGQIVRVGSHVLTALLSDATGPGSRGTAPSGSPFLGAALRGPPPAGRRRHRPGSAPCRARHAGSR